MKALKLQADEIRKEDMKKFNAFSMTCYIIMGWCIIAFTKTALAAMTKPGFMWVLAGGIAYTVGAICYGIGKKKKYIHPVFSGPSHYPTNSDSDSE